MAGTGNPAGSTRFEAPFIAIALATTTIGAGHQVFRGALVAVGTLADRLVKPRSGYPPRREEYR